MLLMVAVLQAWMSVLTQKERRSSCGRTATSFPPLESWNCNSRLEWEKSSTGRGKKPLKLKESNWRGESSKKEEEGEGLKQVERVKWNVWRNFLIAAAASKRKSKLVDSWSSIKSEILVLLKNRKQLLFDQCSFA